MNKIAQSLLDLLVNIPGLQIQVMPGFKQNYGVRSQDPRAMKLMEVWGDVENKIADKKFKKPVTMSKTEVIDLEKAGYVQQHGSHLAITQKGSDLIKIMLLNDDSHAFEEKSTLKTASIKCDCEQYISPQNWYKLNK